MAMRPGTTHKGTPKKGEIRNPWGGLGKDGKGKINSKKRFYDVQTKLQAMGYDPIEALIMTAKDEKIEMRIRHDANKELTSLIAPQLKSIEHQVDEGIIEEIKGLKVSFSALLDDHIKEY